MPVWNMMRALLALAYPAPESGEAMWIRCGYLCEVPTARSSRPYVSFVSSITRSQFAVRSARSAPAMAVPVFGFWKSPNIRSDTTSTNGASANRRRSAANESAVDWPRT
ncbi:hypothetical protein QP157_01330 [Sphingomonas sp. LR61]